MVDIEYIDLEKIKECGQDILEQLLTYDETINYLYKRINDMPIKTHEWIGNAANMYVDSFNNFYKKLLDVLEILKEYAQYLIEISQLIEVTIRKVNND